MNHELAWNEMQRWLEQGRLYLEERIEDIAIRSEGWALLEAKRLEGKLDGINNCIQHMEESERMYRVD